ncbi:MAG TPA: hypothetical protein VIK61_18740, partial [Acidimicrobiia bacterium]
AAPTGALAPVDNGSPAVLLARLERLERRLAKQRRKLDAATSTARDDIERVIAEAARLRSQIVELSPGLSPAVVDVPRGPRPASDRPR